MDALERLIIPLLIIIFIVRKIVELSARTQQRGKPPERNSGEGYHAPREAVEEYLESVKTKPEPEAPAEDVEEGFPPYPVTLEEFLKPPEVQPEAAAAPAEEKTEAFPAEAAPLPVAEEPIPEFPVTEAAAEKKGETFPAYTPLIRKKFLPLSKDKLKQGVLLSAILGRPKSARFFR